MRYKVMVFYEGREVYTRGFQRKSKALEFYWWRVGLLESGTARAPGDTIILIDEYDSIVECYDLEGPITSHRQRLPSSAH